jgi:YesN/AraC family two-component response regulator
MRPFEYLTGIRIQKAKEMLTGSGSFKLTEIARSSGYNDTSYFCAVFKEHEGVTPIEFRKLHGIA